MFDTVIFYTRDKIIEVNGAEYSLGELTTDFLNIGQTEYREMQKHFDRAEQKAEDYRRSNDLSDWWSANEELMRLDEMLMQYKVFQAVRDQEFNALNETAMLTGQFQLFDTDFSPTEHDYELQNQINEYYQYWSAYEEFSFENPYVLRNTQTGEETVLPLAREEQPTLPEKTDALRICFGSVDVKWSYYETVMVRYRDILHDIRAFNGTIRNIVRLHLSDLHPLNSQNYAAALYDLWHDPNRNKVIVNPADNHGDCFYMDDLAAVKYIPREVPAGSGKCYIYEQHEVKHIQAFLKADFMKTLMAGYIIRCCEHCDRYFLLKKGYHTKYCDNPAPENPRFTCNQMGYRSRGVKEAAADNPKHGSLLRALSRIEKDYSRGIVTAGERDALFRLARDLYNESMTSSRHGNEQFEGMMQSENLYLRLGVIRKTKPRGRPKIAAE